MKIIEVEQNSPEWHGWRDNRYTASNADVIMDCAPSWRETRTWNDLRLAQAGFAEPVSDFVQRMYDHGHEAEALARSHLGLQDALPACIEKDDGSLFAASLDGWHAEFGIWLEIKAPAKGTNSTTWRTAETESDDPRDRIPEHIWWQLVHQAGCIGAAGITCMYVVWISDTLYHEIAIPIETLLEDWPALEAEWLRWGQHESQGRDDSPWRQAAADWLRENAAEAEAKANKEAAAAALIELAADGAGEKGCGVKVSLSERKGSVSWKNVATGLWDTALGDLNDYAESYRGNPVPVQSVKAVKE